MLHFALRGHMTANTRCLKKSDAAIMAAAVLSVALLAGAWLIWHLQSGKLLLLTLVAVPLLLMGIRSWRRTMYPDQLPLRWPQDSPMPDRMKRLDWILWTAGISGIIGAGFLEGPSHRLAREVCWDNFGSYNGLRLLLIYYTNDRKPHPPEISLSDLSQPWIDSVKPIESGHWGHPVQH
jgi:hypothetical protein